MFTISYNELRNGVVICWDWVSDVRVHASPAELISYMAAYRATVVSGYCLILMFIKSIIMHNTLCCDLRYF